MLASTLWPLVVADTCGRCAGTARCIRCTARCRRPCGPARLALSAAGRSRKTRTCSARGCVGATASHKQPAASAREAPSSSPPGQEWTVEDSAELYGISSWGASYFGINAQGRVCVSVDERETLDVYALALELEQRNINLPVVVHILDVVGHRLRYLQGCFDEAIARYQYGGSYQALFPVKANHDSHFLNEFLMAGSSHRAGLEAGSKPELLLAMAALRHSPGGMLVCNGYKDAEYIRTVLRSQQLGRHAVIVIEKLHEVHIIVEQSKRLGITPVLGVRAKLSTQHSGHWGTSSGDRAKFGLSCAEILEVTRVLKEQSMLQTLQLLHFHIGSQIPSISTIKEAMREVSHLYSELVRIGADMKFLDVGGGLGIDYDGSASGSKASSTNYTLQNYANDVVAALQDTCIRHPSIRPPTILSESGRALSSFHSLLLFDVLASSGPMQEIDLHVQRVASQAGQSPEPDTPSPGGPGPYLLKTFSEVLEAMDSNNYNETYNDALQFMEEARSGFKLGVITLEERAAAEGMYWDCCAKVVDLAGEQGRRFAPSVEAITERLSSIYMINLSIFRSCLDVWAIDQLFPVMPLHRLDEKPGVEASLADITCDSDGKISCFASGQVLEWASEQVNAEAVGGAQSLATRAPSGLEGTASDQRALIRVHALEDGTKYILGMFLAGAYQRAMGNLHNLFGSTHNVYVRMGAKGSRHTLERVIRGHKVADVLDAVHHRAEDMQEIMRVESEVAVAEGRMSIEEAQELLKSFDTSLDDYTYLH